MRTPQADRPRIGKATHDRTGLGIPVVEGFQNPIAKVGSIAFEAAYQVLERHRHTRERQVAQRTLRQARGRLTRRVVRRRDNGVECRIHRLCTSNRLFYNFLRRNLACTDESRGGSGVENRHEDAPGAGFRLPLGSSVFCGDTTWTDRTLPSMSSFP